jgi:hypothetical protein
MDQLTPNFGNRQEQNETGVPQNSNKADQSRPNDTKAGSNFRVRAIDHARLSYDPTMNPDLEKGGRAFLEVRLAEFFATEKKVEYFDALPPSSLTNLLSLARFERETLASKFIQ